MKFTIKNNILIKNIKKISRLLIKNNSFPILENILIEIKNNILYLTTTNLEIELIAKIKLIKNCQTGKTTISGKKILNICQHLPLTSTIQMQLKNKKMHIASENSNYILSTLSSDNFPNHQNFIDTAHFNIRSDILKKMIENTAFSMGKQDVRHYLNGMLLEKKDNILNSVATDGYRLATTSTYIKDNVDLFSIIIPSKGIIELNRLLNITPKLLNIFIGNNNIRIYIDDIVFTSQLIEGQYPDYKNVIYTQKKNAIIINSDLLKKSLLRTAIFTHEKFCGVEIKIENGIFRVLSDNQEEEIAEDTFSIDYFESTIEISINVYYILDVLNVIQDKNILFYFNPSASSIQITEEKNSSQIYVIMLLKR